MFVLPHRSGEVQKQRRGSQTLLQQSRERCDDGDHITENAGKELSAERTHPRHVFDRRAVVGINQAKSQYSVT